MLEPKPLSNPHSEKYFGQHDQRQSWISWAEAFTSSSASVLLCRCGFGGFFLCMFLCVWILLRRTFHFALVLLYLASYTNFHVCNIVYL